MKIHTECVPCLIKRIIFEARECTTDKKKQTQVIQEACKKLSELYNPDRCSADIATHVHKKVYEILGDSDPYKQLKQKSNRVAHSLLPRVEELVSSSSDPLKTSMLCAIVGNMMDFGIEGGSTNPQALQETFETIYAQGLGYDDYPRLQHLIHQARRIVLFTDNCGEIVFDKILCRELKAFNPAVYLTLVVKGEPILSDATREDAEKLHFQDVVDDIQTTNCFAVGVNVNQFTDTLNQTVDRCDLIICKGMANYESFSETEYHPIAYLMRTKCHPIASSMGVPQDANVIKVYE